MMHYDPCAAAKRPAEDKSKASKKAQETVRKNQKAGPDRKGKDQEQDMKQETMGNQWAIEKVLSACASTCKGVDTAAAILQLLSSAAAVPCCMAS